MFAIYLKNKLKIRAGVFLCLALVIISAAFSPALKNGFVNWDDDLYITNNPVVQSVSLANCKKIFSSFFVANYQPVTILLFLSEHYFFKLNPFGYHLTSLTLHLLNYLLVFWFFFMLTGRFSVSWLTALFFGIHPLQVESVAWISETKNVLYAFFFLGAMISYLYYLRKEKAKRYYFLSLFLFILSLLSKSMAVTLPLVLFILDYFFRRRFNKAVFLEKIPYFVLSLVFGIIAVLSTYGSGGIRAGGLYSPLHRLGVASYDILFYLSKLFLPLKLSAMYPYSAIREAHLYVYAFSLVFVLLASIALSGRRTKKIILGAGLFLLTILPALQFVRNGEIIVADRYVYLSSIGIFYILAEGFLRLNAVKVKPYFLKQAMFLIVLAAVAGVLVLSTWQRCGVWKDGLSLWSDVISKNPGVTTNAYNNLSVQYNSMGKPGEAVSVLWKTIRNDPLDAKLYVNIANSYKSLGKTVEAVNYYKKAIEIDKNIKEAYFNLADSYKSLGKTVEAVNYYKKAIEIDKDFWEAYLNIGVVYIRLGRKEQALSMLKKALEINPGFTGTYINLAGYYKNSGQAEEVILLYKKAIANNLDYFEAYFNIGNLYSDTGKNREALVLYKRAIKIRPNSAGAYAGLGSSYCAIGKNKEAVSALKKAIELDPSMPVAYYNLAVSYYYGKKYDLAVRYCDKAMELGYKVDPQFLESLEPHRITGTQYLKGM